MFSPVSEESDPKILGALVETALIAQLIHSSTIHRHYYARWRSGEVDLVTVGPTTGKPTIITEVKWSDRIVRDASVAKHLVAFAKQHGLTAASLSTRSCSGELQIDGVTVDYLPVAIDCLVRGDVYVREKLKAGEHPRQYEDVHLQLAAEREAIMRRQKH